MNTVIIHEATHYVTTRYLIEHPKLRHTLREYVKYLN
nr:MAG TPA: metallopeptidase [Caudoviricetes sp.]